MQKPCRSPKIRKHCSEHICDAHAASSKFHARFTKAVGVQGVSVELSLFAPEGFDALASALVVSEDALQLPGGCVIGSTPISMC